MKQTGNEDRFVQALKGTQYIVINTCYGGYGLSELALERYRHYTGSATDSYHDIPRDDPMLVKVVYELGSDAYGGYAKLKVVEVPGNVEWQIEEHDGNEWVAEVHRTWS